jgi:hypothetical protein
VDRVRPNDVLDKLRTSVETLQETVNSRAIAGGLP